MMTNPEYRQDPWRECILQMLEICDHVVVVYGRDKDLILKQQFTEQQQMRMVWEYLEWPQPRWTLVELPNHLNKALEIARLMKPDWIIKFDTDYFIHENHRKELRNKLDEGMRNDAMIVSLEKIQFYTGENCLMKGDIPICLDARYPIYYGYDANGYTDLCQPILWDKETYAKISNRKIPAGTKVPKDRIRRSGSWLWNYGYAFKTEERARELLYNFELAHADFWGFGWMKKHPDDITEDTAMLDFLRMVAGRVNRANKKIQPHHHPMHIREKLKNLTPEQFGYNLWGKIKILV